MSVIFSEVCYTNLMNKYDYLKEIGEVINYEAWNRRITERRKKYII